jgi:hypothetical protein
MLQNMEKRLQSVEKSLLSEIREVKKELNEVTTSMSFINKKFEEIQEENANLKVRIEILEKKITGTNCETEENSQLTQKAVQELKIELKEKDQYDRNRNLEINGLDWPTQENLRDTVQRVANCYGLDFHRAEHVDVGHRIPNKNKNKASTIILQFKHRESRDAWLAAKRRIVTNDNVFGNGHGSRIYLNENMSPFYKDLFWKTKNFAKENEYKYVWFKQGKIMMRKHEKDNLVRVIKCEADLVRNSNQTNNGSN